MNYKSFFKPLLPILLITVFASCDRDEVEIGANIIGIDNFTFGTRDSIPVTAYNADLGPVASNNLPINPLGIYNNTVFGQTKAHFVTQVQLATENPTFGVNPVIDSVILSVPYKSTRTAFADNGVGIYKIDSIHGPDYTTNKIAISVYRSNYYMRDLDPATGERQLFYTNQNAEFAANVVGGRLNNADDATQNDEFVFSDKTTFSTNESETDSSRVENGPRLKMFLDKDAFQTTFFSDLANGQFVNNNIFKNYFRGLYFNVNQSGSYSGNLAQIDFTAARIKIYYKEGEPNDADLTTPATRIKKILTLNLTGNTASLLEQSNVPGEYTSALQNADAIAGDPKLYLKGGQGSMAVIDLFSTLGDLERLRSENILVNDASLTFTIENDFANLGSSKPVEPYRIYLFDINNKRPILDYYTDQSADPTDAKYSKQIHDGILQKSSDGKGTKYRIRITQHIRGLINNADSTNVKLGLVVTENIMVTNNKKLKNTAGFIKEVPLMSVAHPFGTVLYGSNIPANDPNYDKRLKLEIYFTKPN